MEGSDTMHTPPKKFRNLEERLPKLQQVLCSSLQSDFLEIRKINISCEKFQKLAEKIPEIKEAAYVIFSKYIKREDHENETFVFIGDTGETLCHVSGREIALYGMLEGCGLEVSEEYACSWHEEKHGL
jgi:hypothetical protein